MHKNDNIQLECSVNKILNEKSSYVEKSAFGIHLRFIDVSNVTGKMARTVESTGRPDCGAAKLFTSW